MRQVEDALGEPLEVAIRRLYLVEKRTIAEAAEEIERITSIPVNLATLAAWMVRLRVTRKDLVAEVARGKEVA